MAPGETVEIDYSTFITATSPDVIGCVSFLRLAVPATSTSPGVMTATSCIPDPFFRTLNSSPCVYESPLGTLTDTEGIHSGTCSLQHSPTEESAKYNMTSSSFSAASGAPSGTITFEIQAVEQNTVVYSNVGSVTITINGPCDLTTTKGFHPQKTLFPNVEVIRHDTLNATAVIVRNSRQSRSDIFILGFREDADPVLGDFPTKPPDVDASQTLIADQEARCCHEAEVKLAFKQGVMVRARTGQPENSHLDFFVVGETMGTFIGLSHQPVGG